LKQLQHHLQETTMQIITIGKKLIAAEQIAGQAPFLQGAGMSGFRVEAANPRSSAEVSL
jgi:hypothetical protein